EKEDRGARVFSLAAFGLQVMADLSTGDENALRILDLVIRHERQKMRAREIGEVGTRIGMAQHALRREYDQRLTPGTLRLAAQHVEVVGRVGWLANDDIVLGGELHKTLNARARMLGALAFVAVW